MRTRDKQVRAFQKVGECLYRYASNGVYYARFKTHGKEIMRSLRTTDPAIARRNLAQCKAEQDGIDRSRGKCSLSDLADEYFRTAQHQKPATLELKKLIVRRIKNEWPTGSLAQVARIKPSHVRAWLTRVCSPNKKRDSYASRSHNIHLAAIKQILERALDDGLIAFNPAAKLKPIKLERPIRRTPSLDEFKAIVASIRSQEFNGHDADESADFVEFIGLAGLGQAEAAALTWDDVDWRREQITTFRHKTKSGFAIPLYPQLRPLLEKRHAQRSPSFDRVFKIKDAKKAVAAACRRLKLPAYSHRSFRRMFVTRAIERGVDVKVIAEWQGHRDGGKLILGTYSHVRPVHSQRMAALMTDEQPENVVQMSKAQP
jgi:integrase